MVESGELRPPLLIIVEALDRLSRENPWIAHGRLSNLVGRGIFIATVADDRIYHLDSDLSDLIISVVLVCAAHKASQDTSFRVRETKLKHVQDAMQTKHVIHQNCPAWMTVADKISRDNRGTRKYQLIDRHAETVLLIFQMGLDHGSDYITRKLIENKVEPFGRTGTWSLRTIKKVLRSRAPIGHLESRHGIVEGLYPRVPGLTDELWLAVQAAQDARRDAGQGAHWKSERVNLLAGIGTCAMCGGPMRLSQNDKTTRRYYGCRRHALLHTCDNPHRYRVDLIEAAVLDRFGFGWLQAKPTKPVVNVAALEAEHAKLKGRERRLAGKLQELDDDQTADLVLDQLRELRGKVTDAATRLQAARQQQAAADIAPIKIKDSSDRAGIATALKAQLTSARFGAGNVVELESQSHVLTVTARADTGVKPQLALKLKGDAKRIVFASRAATSKPEIKWLKVRRGGG